MYDCDKGYVLENGPVSVSRSVIMFIIDSSIQLQSGATCIGGKWSPSELPECLPGQHPRLRWNRKKRSVDLKFVRGKFLLNHYRNIKRKHFDHQVVEDFVKTASNREKRSLKTYRGRRTHQKSANIIHLDIKKLSRRKRSLKKHESRDYSEIDRAYSKYYEKIKARYRNYVKNLFPTPKLKSPLLNNSYPMQTPEEVKHTKKIQVQDGRWYNSYDNPEFRYRVTHKARAFSNDLQNDEYENEMGPVALPSINDPARYNRHWSQPNETVSNYFPTYHHHTTRHSGPDDSFYEKFKKLNRSSALAASIYAQLQSQMVRRKRDVDEDSKGKLTV